jgi:hypothetical protein
MVPVSDVVEGWYTVIVVCDRLPDRGRKRASGAEPRRLNGDPPDTARRPGGVEPAINARFQII